jgi:hypothetical protein
LDLRGLKPRESVAAKGRQEATRAKKGEQVKKTRASKNGEFSGGANFTPPSRKARDVAARAVGRSHLTLAKARAVMEGAKKKRAGASQPGPVANSTETSL